MGRVRREKLADEWVFSTEEAKKAAARVDFLTRGCSSSSRSTGVRVGLGAHGSMAGLCLSDHVGTEHSRLLTPSLRVFGSCPIAGSV